MISLPFTILQETDDWLAINKPVHLRSVPRFSWEEPDSVTHFLLQHCPALSKTFPTSIGCGAVHRLDRDTSGVMLIAKTRHALSVLNTQFRKRSITKKYWALVEGWPQPAADQIDLPITYTSNKHFATGVTERLMQKESQTFFRTLERFALDGQRYSLLEVQPVTGRKHQIRFHLAEHHHPLVGDAHYNTLGTNIAESLRKHFHAQALHAYSIEFFDPVRHEPVCITCLPPQLDAESGCGFLAALDLLRLSSTTTTTA